MNPPSAVTYAENVNFHIIIGMISVITWNVFTVYFHFTKVVHSSLELPVYISFSIVNCSKMCHQFQIS